MWAGVAILPAGYRIQSRCRRVSRCLYQAVVYRRGRFQGSLQSLRCWDVVTGSCGAVLVGVCTCSMYSYLFAFPRSLLLMTTRYTHAVTTAASTATALASFAGAEYKADEKLWSERRSGPSRRSRNHTLEHSTENRHSRTWDTYTLAYPLRTQSLAACIQSRHTSRRAIYRPSKLTAINSAECSIHRAQAARVPWRGKVLHRLVRPPSKG